MPGETPTFQPISVQPESPGFGRRSRGTRPAALALGLLLVAAPLAACKNPGGTDSGNSSGTAASADCDRLTGMKKSQCVDEKLHGQGGGGSTTAIDPYTKYGKVIQAVATRIANGQDPKWASFVWDRKKWDPIIPSKSWDAVIGEMDKRSLTAGKGSNDKNKAAIACTELTVLATARDPNLSPSLPPLDPPGVVVIAIRSGKSSVGALRKKGLEAYKKGNFSDAADYCSYAGNWTIQPPYYNVDPKAQITKLCGDRCKDTSVLPFPENLRDGVTTISSMTTNSQPDKSPALSDRFIPRVGDVFYATRRKTIAKTQGRK